MDLAVGRPAEEKETNGDEEAADERGLEPVLGRAEALRSHLGIHDRVDVDAVDGDGDEDGDGDGEEGQTELADVEAVELEVDDWEGFEEGIVDLWLVGVSGCGSGMVGIWDKGELTA